MRKEDFIHIIKRIKQLILTPEKTWTTILRERQPYSKLFISYIIYPTMIASACIFIPLLVFKDISRTIILGIQNCLVCILSSYLCLRLSRAYMYGKITNSRKIATDLSIYSSTVFILFHSLSLGLGQSFIGDVASVCSLLSLRVLYVGLKKIPDLEKQHHTSTFIIMGLLVVVSPFIISRLLSIIFRIPI